MRSAIRSRAARAACVAVVLLALGACSSDDTRQVAADSSASAAASSPAEDAPAAPVADSDDAGQGSWDEETLVPAMMAAIEDQKTAHFTMAVAGDGATMDAKGDLAFRGKRSEMAMVMDGAAFGGGTVEMRVVDRVAYLSMPPMTPEGKFVEVRPGDPDSPLAGMAGQMHVDPRDSVKALRTGLREVTFVGVETVDGEELERYRITVDVRAAAKAQGMPPMAGAPKTVDYDMWLDQEALMRRMELDMSGVTMKMELSAWGEPVTIEAPARRDIVEGPNRMRG
ncbi:MAG TPA: LppX_LprAFG lipoprotein [Nocardioidaceae bacterium]|nr:LppX_LprAFG lipoprotein [Nocardioidaceae bacterium]